MNVYCHGVWSALIDKDGWLWCGNCDTPLWRTGTTFAMEGSGVSSDHAENKSEKRGGEEPEDRAEDDVAGR